jgi:raffinose/stachyose/melibiose transport system substrate-binding protein
MKRISKRVACLFAALTLVLSMGGCGKKPDQDGTTDPQVTSGGSSAEKPVLKMWHITVADTDGNRTILLNAIKAAEEKFNVKIEEVGTENEAYKTKIKSAMSSDTGPDLFFTWAAGFSKPFVDAGKVLQLDDYMADFKDQLLPGITDNFSYDGKVYGLPYQMQVAPLFCNKEMFEKNNVKIPETYDELLTAVKTFAAKGITPMMCGAKDMWPAMFYYDVLALRTAGAQQCNDTLSGKGSFTAPEFVEAAKKLQELANAGAFGKDALAVSWDEAQNGFAAEKAAMIFNGNWVSGTANADSSAAKGKVIVTKFPSIPGGKGTQTEYFGGAGDGYMINSKTKDPKLAVDVLAFLLQKLAADMYEANTGMPGWKVSVDESKVNQMTKDMVNMTNDATAWNIWWDVFLEGAKADTHKNLVVELMTNKITPEDFCQQMQELMEEE